MPTNRVASLLLRGAAGPLRSHICWPGSSTTGLAPLLVFLTAADAAPWCQELSASTGLVVLSVICERPYPADLPDAFAATDWAAEHTARLGANPRHLLVGGAGHGGALAAAVALRASADGWPAFSRQVLISAGPVEPTATSLAGVAQTTAVTVEHDPAGDEGRYAARLRHAGVAIDELRYAASDPATAIRIRNSRQVLADVGAALTINPNDDAAGRGNKEGR